MNRKEKRCIKVKLSYINSRKKFIIKFSLQIKREDFMKYPYNLLDRDINELKKEK